MFTSEDSLSPNLKHLREHLIDSAKERDIKDQVGVLWAVSFVATHRQMDPIADWDQICVEQLSNLLERKRPNGNRRQRLGIRTDGRHDFDWIEQGFANAVDQLLIGARPAGVAAAPNKLVDGADSGPMVWLLRTMIESARGTATVDLGATFTAFVRSDPEFESLLLDGSKK
ncbi:MAG TPA: hypothetical protein VJL88_04530 [Nitrospira sp.]|nr:hypothetical protein [Nitrospira sp.]